MPVPVFRGRCRLAAAAGPERVPAPRVRAAQVRRRLGRGWAGSSAGRSPSGRGGAGPSGTQARGGTSRRRLRLATTAPTQPAATAGGSEAAGLARSEPRRLELWGVAAVSLALSLSGPTPPKGAEHPRPNPSAPTWAGAMAEQESLEFGKADFVLMDTVSMPEFMANLRLRWARLDSHAGVSREGALLRIRGDRGEQLPRVSAAGWQGVRGAGWSRLPERGLFLGAALGLQGVMRSRTAL